MIDVKCWDRARAGMSLEPDVIYLNSGSFGALPRRVHETVSTLREEMAAQPTQFMLHRIPGLLWEARECLARFVGAPPNRLMFASNVSEAINLIASSLDLAPPAEILITDHEYQPMRWCWERVAQKTGLKLHVLKLPHALEDPAQIVAVAKAALNARTKLFFFSHVLSATGTVMPAAALCAAANALNIATVIDGAHAPGFLDLDLNAIDCDYYIGSGSKWLLAPPGTGFLYFGRMRMPIFPATVSWGYRQEATEIDDCRDRFGSTPRMRQFECAGTRDICPWLAVPSAIEFRQEFTSFGILRRMHDLARHATDCLEELPGVVSVTPRCPALRGAIATFELPKDCDEQAIQHLLWTRHRLQIGATRWSGGPLLRVSTHFFNAESDILTLVQALFPLLKHCAS